jgi:hypothetical protein
MHSVFELLPAPRLVSFQPGQARRPARHPTHRDADPLPRPGAARCAPRGSVSRRRLRPNRAGALPHGRDDRTPPGRAAWTALARRRLLGPETACRSPVRARGVRRSQVRRIGPVRADGGSGCAPCWRFWRPRFTRPTAISSSATLRPAARSIARSSSAGSSKRYSGLASVRSHSTSCGTRSERGWQRPARHYARFSTGPDIRRQDDSDLRRDPGLRLAGFTPSVDQKAAGPCRVHELATLSMVKSRICRDLGSSKRFSSRLDGVIWPSICRVGNT